MAPMTLLGIKMRRTLASLMPAAVAIVRVFQCVAREGFSCVVW
jgi:hypothetical protein